MIAQVMGSIPHTTGDIDVDGRVKDEIEIRYSRDCPITEEIQTWGAI